MPKAEIGSTKHIANQLKSKGLQRLRWWCEACHKQCRDENGYKCHTMSESHVRNMQTIGMNANRVIANYSNDFQRSFLQLLRTAHGTKQVHMNKFYQEVIADKEHVHMNSTRWNSLTEFAKHLSREGLIRVEENDKGLHISWIDNSPEALRRAETIRKKERQDKGDEEREKRLINEQIDRANAEAEAQLKNPDVSDGELIRTDGAKITLDFGGLSKTRVEIGNKSAVLGKTDEPLATLDRSEVTVNAVRPIITPVSIKLGTTSKAKNVFASSSKKGLPGAKTSAGIQVSQRPMSEAERIMRDELSAKREKRPTNYLGGLNQKKQRI